MKIYPSCKLLVPAFMLGGISIIFTASAAQPFQLPPLPYDYDSLEPHISSEVMKFHYFWHHKGYLDNLNELTAGTEREEMSLEEIIAESSDDPALRNLFNNAAQVWNHTFFWQSMHPEGGGPPAGIMLDKIEESFGSYAKFRQELTSAATGEFASGWVWLIQEDEGLKIESTTDAETPIAQGRHPLLTLDVWEHAYYLDYQNRRGDFVKVYLDYLIDWKFAESRLQ